ncbi:MAG: arsenate reductase [Marinosulfonomonas sp.]|nr:arsenate reductase [Marinosulfonomonas sp.]
MEFYGLKTCDTCRKAIRELRQSGQEPTVIDVRDDGVPDAQIAQFLAAFGSDLVNRRSTTWRNLSEAERSRDPAALLAAYPTLMKRPVIVDNGAYFLGWGADVRAKLLG